MRDVRNKLKEREKELQRETVGAEEREERDEKWVARNAQEEERERNTPTLVALAPHHY
jgi:hypothetical protein